MLPFNPQLCDKFGIMNPYRKFGLRPKIGLVFALFVFCNSGTAQQTAADSTVLKVGRPLTVKIAGKARHSYTVNLEKGMYLAVAVTQTDVDVLTEVLDPESRSLGTFDAPTSERGMEEARIGAASTGKYRIDVFTASELAGPGKYKIEITALRQINERDARVLKAVGFQQEAIRLRQKPETRINAIQVYEKAVEIWRELRLPTDEANTLRSIAFAYQRMQQFDKAKEYFAKALAIWERIGDTRSAAFTHVIHGVYARRDNDFKAALAYDLRARKLWLKAKDKPEQTHNLVQIGDDYMNLSERRRAFARYQQALDLIRRIGRKSIEAQVLNKYGDAYAKIGKKAEALAMYRRSVELWKLFRQDEIAEGVEAKIAKLSNN